MHFQKRGIADIIGFSNAPGSGQYQGEICMNKKRVFIVSLILMLALSLQAFAETPVYKEGSRGAGPGSTGWVSMKDGRDYVPMKRWRNSLIELLNIAGVQAAFVLYPTGETVNVSARSGGSVNVRQGFIMANFGRERSWE